MAAYGNAQDHGHVAGLPPQQTTVIVAQQAPSPNPGCHGKGAVVCGIAQVVFGITMIGLGGYFYAGSTSTAAFIAGVLGILGGAFGIHSGVTGTNGTAVATLVISILAAIVAGSCAIAYSIWYAAASWVLAKFYLRGYLGFLAAEAAFCFLEFVVAIVQSGFGCAMTCCKTQSHVGLVM